MARDHARIFTSIWSDDDFTALSGRAQRLFFLLLSQPSLSYCGVVGMTVRRWAKSCSGSTAENVHEALEELEAAGFVVADHDTEEVLIRSFMRNDGLLRTPNMAKAAMRACAAVLSAPIREALAGEVGRCMGELTGRSLDVVREAFPDTTSKGSPKGSAKGSPKGLATTTTTTTTSTTTKPLLTADAESDPTGDAFDRFWDTYPRKVGKPKARTAFARAIKRSDPQAVISGAETFATDPNLPEVQFVPHPTTWLNRDGWLDPPCPPKAATSRTDDVLRREMERAHQAQAFDRPALGA